MHFVLDKRAADGWVGSGGEEGSGRVRRMFVDSDAMGSCGEVFKQVSDLRTQ